MSLTPWFSYFPVRKYFYTKNTVPSASHFLKEVTETRLTLVHLKKCQGTPESFGSVPNTTVQQHPDAKVFKAHIGLTNEQQNNRGPPQMLVTIDLVNTKELKNYYYLCRFSI